MGLEDDLGAATQVETELGGDGQGEEQAGADNGERDERAYCTCGHAKPPAVAPDRPDAEMTGSSTAAGVGRRATGGRGIVAAAEALPARGDGDERIRGRWPRRVDGA